MKNALVCRGRALSSHGGIGREIIRRLAAVKDVTYAVTAAIASLEHGQEVDVSAVLRRSAAARDEANRFIESHALRFDPANGVDEAARQGESLPTIARQPALA